MELRTDRLKLKKLFPDKAKKYAQSLHKKATELEFIRKGIPIDPGDIEIKEGERAAIRLITTPHLDRDGEILIPSGAILDDFRQSPSVLYGHDYRSLPIGSDQWIKQTKEGILAKTIYAKHQFAEDVFQCVKDKHLNSNSVGFIPVEAVNKEKDKKAFAKWQGVLEKDYGIDKEESGKAGAIYTKWIMLEHSDVPVASNAQSLNLAVSKGELVIQSDRLKKDLEIAVVKDKDIEIEVTKGKDGVTIFGRPVIDPETGKPIKKEDMRDKGIEVVKESKRLFEEGLNADHLLATGEGIAEKTAGKIEVIKESDDKKEEKSKGEKADKAGTEEEKETIEIEEIAEDVMGLLRIEDKKKLDAKALEVIKKYDINKADVFGQFTPGYLINAIEQKCKVKLSFDKYGNPGIKGIKPSIEYQFESIDAQMGYKQPEYKERWNKSLSKVFDVEHVESQPSTFEYALLEKFLECKTSKIFQNNHFIPSPLIGTQLAGIKAALSKYKLKDTRKFHYNGQESPPQYEMIRLSSTETDDFLVEGTAFYDAGGIPLAIRFSPSWYGMSVSFSTNRKHMEWNKEVLMKSLDLADKNNKLKGEKFALSGEFLEHTDDDWDNLILPANDKDSIKKSGSQLKKKGEDCPGRGLLFVGAPGTGKTKTGRVLLNEIDSTFIWVSSKDFSQCSPLFALTLAFDMARKLTPSVLFLEDIDTWIKDYMTDLLKTELDGIQQNKGVISILTSNFPEKLPDALLDRPGRFHHVINFVLPGKDQRKEMLERWAGDIGSELIAEIIGKTEGFSGAHMKELIDFAKIIVEEEKIDIGDALLKSLDKLIGQRELIEAIRNNKVDVKAFWNRAKWVDGEIKTGRTWDDLNDEEKRYASKTGKRLLGEIEDDILVKGTGGPIPQGAIELKPDIIDYTTLESAIKSLTEQVAELKEGRVLSTKNRTLVKDIRDLIRELDGKLTSLLDATEPTSREEERGIKRGGDDGYGGIAVVKNDDKVGIDKLATAIESALSGDSLKKMLDKSLEEAVDVAIKKKLGKVE